MDTPSRRTELVTFSGSSEGVSGEDGLGCRGLCVSFPTQGNGSHEILRNITFQARKGEFISILGPSGCGKTTLLNILCGLLRPEFGEVVLGTKLIQAPTREVGMVFQDCALFPWLTVQGNVEFGIMLNGLSKPDRQTRTKMILEKVGLWAARSKYPHQLSGGMKQRVAIARVLANDSESLLMDEPFGALDYQTRFLMQQFLIDIWTQFRRTIVFVTHQVDEAILMSDRIFLMSANPGMLAQELQVSLSRPRDVTSKEFNDYRARVTAFLEMEVTKSFQRQFE